MNTLGSVKTFALDFDSVLADTMVIWVKEYNERYHTNINKSDIYAWDISKILPIAPKEISELFNYVWEYRWEEIPPCELNQNNTIENIHKSGFRISILTKKKIVSHSEKAGFATVQERLILTILTAWYF